MSSRGARLGLAVGLVILVFLIVAASSWDFVRDAIAVPIYYLLWIANLILGSIPQGVYLGILLLTCLFISIFTVGGMQISPRLENSPAKQPQSFSRYLLWKTWCDQLSYSNFSKDHFAGEARRLILSILAFQEGVDAAEVEALIGSAALPVPDAVKQLVLHKEIRLARQPSHPLNDLSQWLRNLFRRDRSRQGPQQGPQLDGQSTEPVPGPVAEIVGYIEYLLEINHAGSHLGS